MIPVPQFLHFPSFHLFLSRNEGKEEMKEMKEIEKQFGGDV
jgi:hypothetical protein